MTKKIKIGKDSVVLGDVTGEVGDRSVVVGSTDKNGNTILNTPMAVGHGAKAGPGSIAIGAGASAGTDLFHLIDALKAVPEVSQDQTLISTIDSLTNELRKSNPEPNTIKSLWSVIQTSATTSGAVNFVQQIGTLLGV